MAKTIIEKILSSHTDNLQAKAGEEIWITLDIISARDFGGANVVKNFENFFPNDAPAFPEKTMFTFDCVVPAKTIPYANNQHICRQYAAKHDLKVHDVDSGIGTHVLMEQGLAVPGTILVGTDSHMNILGAVGAFGQGMGDQDIAFAYRTGKTWFEVPESMKINVIGTPSKYCTAKDITLAVLRKLGAKGALGKSMELYGEPIDKMTFSDRVTLSSMATEMGAIAGIIPPNDMVLDYCKKRSNIDIKPVFADKDAEYSEEVTIDISDVNALISLPGRPDDVVDITEAEGRKVDSVFIGSCTNGRFEDFELFTKVMGDKKVKPGVMVRAVPATKEVYGELIKSGLLSKLFESGVIISNPGCGGCASGQIGMTGTGEVQVSTGNRNFTGKQGNGDTYLVGPVVAACAAVTGELINPEKV